MIIAYSWQAAQKSQEQSWFEETMVSCAKCVVPPRRVRILLSCNTGVFLIVFLDVSNMLLADFMP